MREMPGSVWRTGCNAWTSGSIGIRRFRSSPRACSRRRRLSPHCCTSRTSSSWTSPSPVWTRSTLGWSRRFWRNSRRRAGMHKALLVARYEYRRFARRRAFLLGTIGFPLLLVVIAGVGVLVGLSAEGETIGYVDRAGVLAPAVLEEEYAEGLQTEDLQAFGAEEEGREALRTGRIDVLFLLPETYLEDRSAIVYLPAGSEQALGDETRRTFATFIEASLAYQYQPASAPLLMDGPAVTVRAGDRERTAGPEAIVGFFLPFVAGILFLIAAVSSAGYLLQAVSDEKENRTAEILTTSVSPAQLIIGKAVGLVGVAGAQLAVWATGGVVAYVIAAQFVPVLAEVEVPWVLLGTVFIFFVPAYLLLAGIMVSIGSAFPEYQQSQQVVAVVNILFFVPFFFSAMILANPSGPLAVGLTLLPTTSFITVPLRSGAGDIPGAQLVLSWVILVVSAGMVVGTAPRIFRAGSCSATGSGLICGLCGKASGREGGRRCPG